MNKAKTSLAIIIIHFGDELTTKKCLESIYAYEKKIPRIIIVNNSPVSLIDPLFYTQEITIITSGHNLGYAKAVNKGLLFIESLQISHVLLLNNDTFFSTSILDTLQIFLMKKSSLSIVGPSIVFSKNNQTMYDMGGYINLFLGTTRHKNVATLTDMNARVVDYVSGCCMFFSLELVKKIGLFDEKFFLYCEDVDFCMRAKRAGYDTYLLPSVHITHHLSQTIKKESIQAIWYQTLSGLYLGRKYAKHKIINYLFLIIQALYRLGKKVFLVIIP